MKIQQFVKGLMMALIGVLVAMFSTSPINYYLGIATAIGTILVYSGENLISLLHSDSQPGQLTLVNALAGIFIAVGNGLVSGFAMYVIDGAIEWDVLLKLIASITCTYLGTTFFAPPHNDATNTKMFLFKRKAWVIIVGLLVIPSLSNAQGPFEGFFRPKAGTLVSKQSRADGERSFQWYFRPAATITAVQFTYDRDIKSFQSSTFSSAGIGLGYQHYVEQNGVLINNYGFNALLMLDASYYDSGISAAATFNALQFVNLGCGYNFTRKEFFILTGAVWNF